MADQDQSKPIEADSSPADRVGSVLAGKWHLDGLIGVGGMASVYAATHRNGSRAALKLLHPEFAREVEVKERFLREGRIANVVDHPARVPVFDDDVTDSGQPFLVMELLEGRTLQEELRGAGGKLPLERVLKVFEIVLDLLDVCHKAGVVHRDIKPANIFLTTPGEVKVLDFGVARMHDAQRENATKAGTALGTPAFMAPEQALGVAQAIDGRADLFAVGACMYTSLSGERLHKSTTENYALVLAATKAAPSIARIAPDLPIEVVALVDKALAFDRASRFQDAATMRQAVLVLLAGLRSGQLSATKAREARGVVVRTSDEVMDESEYSATPEAVARQTALLVEFWRHAAIYLGAVRQYGDHPNTTKALETAFESLLYALSADPLGVRWDVTPYAFMAGTEPIWEPDKAPFDRIPYRLFVDGFRRMQIVRGVTSQEFSDFLALIGSEDAGAGTEDDAVSALWDRRFEHLAYSAVDSFAEGDADEREAFEQATKDVAERVLAVAQIDKSWNVDSTEAEALLRNVTAAMGEAGTAAAEFAMDPLVRASLGAQLAEAPERWDARFFEALAHGYQEASTRGDLELLTDVLHEWVRDQITLRNLTPIFELFDSLRQALVALSRTFTVAEADRMIATAMWTGEDIRAMLDQLARSGAATDYSAADAGPSPVVVDGFVRILPLVGTDPNLSAVCACYQSVKSDQLRAGLLEHVARWATGNESDLAKVLTGAEVDLSLAILRVIAKAPSRQAVLVFDRALRSQHRDVRIEAVQLLANLGERDLIAGQLEGLLADPETTVRREVLRALTRSGAISCVPALMRRLQSPDFHLIPITERREWLATLWRLAPPRAEEILIAIVTEKQLIPSEDIEQTRAVAADLLSSASSEAALKAVRMASRKWWWNSAIVREAAARSADIISAKLRGEAGKNPGADDSPPDSGTES